MRHVLAVLFLVGMAAGGATGAPPFDLRPAPSRTPYLGPYSVYGPGLSYRQPTFYYGPLRTTTIGVQTSVSVPDRGTALVGGYTSARQGRAELGSPIAGKLPYAGRLGSNRAFGRALSSTRITAGVRIISLEEEEYRQTGVRR